MKVKTIKVAKKPPKPINITIGVDAGEIGVPIAIVEVTIDPMLATSVNIPGLFKHILILGFFVKYDNVSVPTYAAIIKEAKINNILITERIKGI